MHRNSNSVEIKDHSNYPAPTKQKAKGHVPFLKKTGKGEISFPTHSFPVSICPFVQYQFIEKVNNHIHRQKHGFFMSRFKPIEPELRVNGNCAGLVLMWYDSLKTIHLLDFFKKNNTDSTTIKKIKEMQNMYQPLLIRNKKIPFSERAKAEGKKLGITQEIADEVLESLMICHNFTRAKEIEWVNSVYHGDTQENQLLVAETKQDQVNFDDDISSLLNDLRNNNLSRFFKKSNGRDLYNQVAKNYFGKLSESGSHDYGLHLLIIMTSTPEILKGHVIGWTHVDDGYLVFEPNLGELYFDSYSKMHQYLIEILIPQYGEQRHQALITRDLYTAEDIEVLNNIQNGNRLSLASK